MTPHPRETDDTLADVLAGCFLVACVIIIVVIVFIVVTTLQYFFPNCGDSLVVGVGLVPPYNNNLPF